MHIDIYNIVSNYVLQNNNFVDSTTRSIPTCYIFLARLNYIIIKRMAPKSKLTQWQTRIIKYNSVITVIVQ
jgi:hypothetical protein